MKQKTTKTIQIKDELRVSKDYQNLLQELRSIMSKGLYKAYKAIDNIKVQTYWQIGERIVREELKHQDRADYGKYLVENLAIDLTIKKRRLYEIVRFYRHYEIVRTVSAQLAWSHYLELIEVEDAKERLFYQNKTILNSWSVRELRKQINNKLYKKTSQSEIDNTLKSTLPQVKLNEIFRDTYDFDFIELQPHEGEKELESKIIQNFLGFLGELGPDFYIGGRQVPIKIAGLTHYIDLVLYHKGIPCNILVDLKIGKLDSRDIGQMNKYINYYRENRQYGHEQDAIGLIICKEADKEEVRYAIGGLEEKIFIAKYKIKLPSESKIKKIIHKL